MFVRDLEDFTRLWFNFSSLHPAISQGEIQIGIKWKNATGAPAIKIYEPIELAGGRQYLTDPTTAQNQLIKTAVPFTNRLAIDLSTRPETVTGAFV